MQPGVLAKELNMYGGCAEAGATHLNFDMTSKPITI